MASGPPTHAAWPPRVDDPRVAAMLAELAMWLEDPKVQQELAMRADDPEVYEDWESDDWESDESANHVRERSPASLPTTVGSGQTSPATAEPTTEVAALLAELADIQDQQRGLALEEGRLLAELQALLQRPRHGHVPPAALTTQSAPAPPPARPLPGTLLSTALHSPWSL